MTILIKHKITGSVIHTEDADTLIGADFSGLDLENADFSNQDLRNVIFFNANMRHADLSNANMRHANMRHADLSNANMRHANMRHADLSNAHMHNANMYNANMYNANMYNANMRHADLSVANMRHANMRGVYLDGANLCYIKGIADRIIDLGIRSDGYRFLLIRTDPGEWRIKAGCRDFTLREAYDHWNKTKPKGDPLGDETRLLIDNGLRIADLRGWPKEGEEICTSFLAG